MRNYKTIKYFSLLLLVGLISFSCVDNVPEIEDLPSAAVDFNYKVTDDSYQFDYYIGSTIEFNSTSYMEGNCEWDFGDGNTGTGAIVTHKYSEAGTYDVKLTVAGSKSRTYPIMVSDIVPIMSVDPIEGGVCEVLETPVSISMELPNPEGLEEEYLWIFPEGTKNEAGEVVESSNLRNPGKLTFGHVGSQTVRLQAKLGGRALEEGRVNVQVAYNEGMPTLYYAEKDGNIMALKLVGNKPVGMNIMPFDMAISSGKKPLNILFNEESLYILDAGQQFTYINDVDGNMGDGRITVMSKDGSKLETMLTNTGAAFDDPFYGYIEGNTLYFSDRNTGLRTASLRERNRSYSLASFPFKVQNATLGYYSNGWSYGSMNAGFGKINGVWYWCKTFNGTGIFRFTDNDILKETITGGMPAPSAGVTLSGMSPKSFVWDAKNKVIYFSVYDTGYEGIYRCTLAQLDAIGSSKGALAP